MKSKITKQIKTEGLEQIRADSISCLKKQIIFFNANSDNFLDEIILYFYV